MLRVRARPRRARLCPRGTTKCSVLAAWTTPYPICLRDAVNIESGDVIGPDVVQIEGAAQP